LEYLWKQDGLDATKTGLPLNVILPWPLNARTDPARWSPHAAWLGPAYNPVFPVFRGEGSREVGNPTANGMIALPSKFDPYAGVPPSSSFRFEGPELPPEVSGVRFGSRQHLLRSLEGRRQQEALRFVRHRRSAERLITDPRLARAVDVTLEPRSIREKYGLT